MIDIFLKQNPIPLSISYWYSFFISVLSSFKHFINERISIQTQLDFSVEVNSRKSIICNHRILSILDRCIIISVLYSPIKLKISFSTSPKSPKFEFSIVKVKRFSFNTRNVLIIINLSFGTIPLVSFYFPISLE